MAAPQHLGRQFAGLVKDYRATATYQTGMSFRAAASPRDLEDPEKAAGTCGAVTNHFDGWLKHNTDSRTQRRQEQMGNKHAFNVVNDHAVDWTARQFFPDASVPHIEPVDDYKAKLTSHFGTKEYRENLKRRRGS